MPQSFNLSAVTFTPSDLIWPGLKQTAVVENSATAGVDVVKGKGVLRAA